MSKHGWLGNSAGRGAADVALVKCTECGGSVSHSANRCPHCGRAPRGATCCICKAVIRLAEAVRVESSESSESMATTLIPDAHGGFTVNAGPLSSTYSSYRFVHRACLLGLFPPVDAPCRDCGRPLDVRTFAFGLVPLCVPVNPNIWTDWGQQDDGAWTAYPGVSRSARPAECPNCGCYMPLLAAGDYIGGKLWSCHYCRLPLLRMQEVYKGYCHKECVRKTSSW